MNEAKENAILSKIIAVYADIWADVLLDENLDRHLRNISDDLGHLNKLIDYREARGLETVNYYQITIQLFRLQEIVRNKIVRMKR